MHIDYTAIGTFLVGVAAPWVRRQLLHTIQYALFSRVVDAEQASANKALTYFKEKFKRKDRE